jgi:LacI family transcriptional regulator
MVHHVTLRDVAEYADVSITTVSNVMRDWPYVSDETRQRVHEAIEKLGYTPHVVARGLRTGQTQAIAFIVPDLANPYFAAIVSAAEDVAQEHGYTLLVFNSHENSEREAICIQRAARRWADGLLISQTAEPQRSALDGLKTPFVAIDRVPVDFPSPFCALDNFRAGQLAAQHLVALGHQSIAHLGGPPHTRPAQERLLGWQSVLDALELPTAFVAHSGISWGCDEGYAAMQHFLTLSETPTAVFASNDRMAIGALRAIQERGMSVPGDVSLVGVDDIEISRFINPPLTTVRQPHEEMARAGIELLLRLMQDDPTETTQVLLQPELMIRQSTAAPRTKA